jgi:putative ABC transport system substrate-binding protein
VKRCAPFLICAWLLAVSVLDGDDSLAGPLLQAGPKIPTRMARIGFMAEDDPDPRLSAARSFLQGMADLGWVTGANLMIEYRYTSSSSDLARAAAEDLVRLGVDVIVTVGTVRTEAAQKVTRSIPIVMASSGDPVASGFVKSLARPGGNITGMSLLTAGLAAKRLVLLKETVPSIRRVLVLWNPDNSSAEAGLRETEAAASGAKIEVIARRVHASAELADALQSARSARANAIVPLGDQLFFAKRTEIARFAREHRLATVHDLRPYVVAGGLMSYGPSLPDLYRRAATHVDKILRGANPAELPVEQPSTFLFVVNLQTARGLGIAVPPSIALQVTEFLQ